VKLTTEKKMKFTTMKRIDQADVKNAVVAVVVGLLLLAAAALIVGCGTGTVITFGKDGIEIQPPAGPIVLPMK
jgi:hypothetical protein